MNNAFMARAIELAMTNVTSGRGGPFGAVIARGQEIVSEGSNTVTSTNDPTAHAEVNAIRNACQRLGAFELQGCQLYTSCEPCPMCLGAVYWSRLDHIYYAGGRGDAAENGFDDALIYDELRKRLEERLIPITQMMREQSLPVFEAWRLFEGRVIY